MFAHWCLLWSPDRKVRERLVWNISPARWSCLPYLNASISFFSREGFCGSPVWDCSQRPRGSDKKRWVEITWPQFLCFEDLGGLANIRFFVCWLRNKQTTTTKKSYVSELLQIHTGIRTLKNTPFFHQPFSAGRAPSLMLGAFYSSSQKGDRIKVGEKMAGIKNRSFHTSFPSRHHILEQDFWFLLDLMCQPPP